MAFSDYTPSRAELVPWIKSELDMEVVQLTESFLQATHIRELKISEVAEGNVYFCFRQSFDGKPGHVINGERNYTTNVVIIEDTTNHDCEDNGCDSLL